MIRHALTCVDGRLMRHDPQSDDPYLQTDQGKCPDCDGHGCASPKATQVQRFSDKSPHLVVWFDKLLTDDEMRDFQEYVKEWEQ